MRSLAITPSHLWCRHAEYALEALSYLLSYFLDLVAGAVVAVALRVEPILGGEMRKSSQWPAASSQLDDEARERERERDRPHSTGARGRGTTDEPDRYRSSARI